MYDLVVEVLKILLLLVYFCLGGSRRHNVMFVVLKAKHIYSFALLWSLNPYARAS